MDDKTRALVTALHEAPNEPGRLEAARAHLMSTGKPGSVVKLLEWWSGKALDPVAASAALLDAARLAASDKARAEGLAQKAVTRAPENPGLRDLHEVVRQEEAVRLYAQRLQLLTEKRAKTALVIGAYIDYANIVAKTGRIDDAIEVILPVAEKDAQAAELAVDLLQQRARANPGGSSDDLRRAVRLLRLQSRQRPAEAEALLGRALGFDPTDRNVITDLEARVAADRMIPHWEAHLNALGSVTEAETRIKLARALAAAGRTGDAVRMLKVFEHEPSIAAELQTLRSSRRDASRVALLADLEAELASAPPARRSSIPTRADAPATLPSVPPAPKAPAFPPRAPAPTTPSSPAAARRPASIPPPNFGTPPSASDFEEEATAVVSPDQRLLEASTDLMSLDRASLANVDSGAVTNPGDEPLGNLADSLEPGPTASAPLVDPPAPVATKAKDKKPKKKAKAKKAKKANLSEPPAKLSFNQGQLVPFTDEDDEADESPMIDVNPRAVLPLGNTVNGGGTSLELVRLRDEVVLGVTTLRSGSAASEGFPGTIKITGDHAVIRLMDADRASHKKKDGSRVEVGNADTKLLVGERLEVERGKLSWVLQIDTSRPLAKGERVLPWMAYAIGGIVAVISHLGLAGAIEVAASAGVVSLEVEDRPQEEIFAEARLLPPEERPQPPPPRRRPRRVRRTKAPTPPESRAELSQNLRNRLRRARTNAPSTGDATQDLVNRLTTPNAGTGQTLQDVTTNIQAVAGGPGASNLSVTGVQSAIAGVSGVNTARASGSANVGPLGGTDAAGTVMGLEMRSTMGPVRGRVRAVSALGRQTGGSLSRAEVQRVINGKVGRIQRCYERALLSNASLAGRIAFSWTIRPNGRVGGVRQASSTLGNAGVSNCVAGVIRSMRFPRPQGGAVQITYPFMFSR